MKKDFLNWMTLIINIFLIIGLISISISMFFKGLNYVYIVCTILILILPFWRIYDVIKKDYKNKKNRD